MALLLPKPIEIGLKHVFKIFIMSGRFAQWL